MVYIRASYAEGIEVLDFKFQVGQILHTTQRANSLPVFQHLCK